MSVMLLTDKHINTLVTYASTAKIKYYHANNWRDVCDDEEKIAQEFFNTNEAAYNQNYPSMASEKSLPFKFKHTPIAGVDSAVQIIKAVECYEYQCDGWSGWDNSLAKSVMNVIKIHAISRLLGYVEADWAIS